MTERIAAASVAGLRGYSPGMAELSMLDGVREVPRAEWDALAAADSPFLEWDWLASLEDAGCLGPESGWAAHPLVVREADRLVAACPLYVKGNSEGEFVFDWGWADAADRAGLHYYPKLLVGVPFTPVAGGRLLTAPGEERAGWLDTLAPALREICTRNTLSGVHVNFCRDDERAALEQAGFLPRLGLQYHWFNHGYQSFDDYLGHLRSKRRNQTRRELRAVREAGISVETFVGDEIPESLFPWLFRVYASTIEKKYWGRQYLNARFFELLRERFRERLCIVAARRGDELLAALRGHRALHPPGTPPLRARRRGRLQAAARLRRDRHLERALLERPPPAGRRRTLPRTGALRGQRCDRMDPRAQRPETRERLTT
jgi:predicted N-acyltransferase